MHRVAIITGAAGNLGTAVIDQFIHHGIVIEGTVMNQQDRDDLSLRNGVQAEIVDLSDEAAAQQFVDGVQERHKRIDACVCLVGGFAMGTINDTDEEALQHMFKLNFMTAYNTLRPAFAHMKQRNFGRIVLVAAKPALEPEAAGGTLAYALAKGQLVNLAKILNEEGRPHNIVTGVVVPSIIDTPANRQAMPNANFEDWVTPTAIAKQIGHLCSTNSVALREPLLKIYGNA